MLILASRIYRILKINLPLLESSSSSSCRADGMKWGILSGIFLLSGFFCNLGLLVFRGFEGFFMGAFGIVRIVFSACS